MYRFFVGNCIKPDGWLRRQLEIQAQGLAGNLDKVWPDIRESAWIGGDREGWERVPYWLDGFIPLAYLLDDEDMIARAERYIYVILDRQGEDGWICPLPERTAEQLRPVGGVSHRQSADGILRTYREPARGAGPLPGDAEPL